MFLAKIVPPNAFLPGAGQIKKSPASGLFLVRSGSGYGHGLNVPRTRLDTWFGRAGAFAGHGCNRCREQLGARLRQTSSAYATV